MRSFVSKHRYGILVSIVVAAAFLLRAHGVRWGLPMVLEEATPMRQASAIWLSISRGHLDLNPHFFNYPSLTIYLQAVLQGIAFAWQRLFGAGFDLETTVLLQRIDPTGIALIGRMTSVVFSAATVAVLYLLVKRVAGRTAGVLAAALLAFAPYHINESRFIQTDPLLGFFTAAAVLLAMRVAEKGRLRDYALFGGAVGLATATKYPGLFVAVCLVPAHYFTARGEKWNLRRALLDRRLAAFLGAAALLFIVTSPYCLLDFHSFWGDFSFERDHMRTGHFGQVGGAGISLPYYVRSVLFRDFGVPLTLLFLFGMFAGFVPRRSRERDLAERLAAARERGTGAAEIMLSLFPLFFLAVVGAWSMRAERYLMPLAPFVAGLPVVVIFCLAGLLGARKALRGAVTGVAFAAVSLQPFMGGIRAAAIAKDTRELARAWILEHAPENSLIAKESLTPDLWRKSDYLMVERKVDSLSGKARARGAARLARTKYYDVVEIPLYVLYPERSAPYYDMRLYAGVDYVVTSSLVEGRYTAERSRFPSQNEWYNDLDRFWGHAASFSPRGQVAGPTIDIYARSGATDSLIAAAKGALEDSWYGEGELNPEDLHRFVKPLAKRAVRGGDYALADALFRAGDRSDPEIRYGLAAMAGALGRYADMLDNVEWLTGTYLLLGTNAGAAGGPAKAGSSSARELTLRLGEILDDALAAPEFPRGLRAKADSLRALCAAD